MIKSSHRSTTRSACSSAYVLKVCEGILVRNSIKQSLEVWGGAANSLKCILQFVVMKKILVVGGSGFLGSKVVSQLSAYHVVSIDFALQNQAKQNILLQRELSAVENNKKAAQEVAGLKTSFDAILVTAGGWVGGSIKDDDYASKLKLMQEVNLYPSLLAGHLATRYLTRGGLLVFTGAASVYKEPQPDMIAYALAKAGVHSLATAIAQKAEKKEQLQGRVITILPGTIDTDSNRAAMPTADFSKWVSGGQIAELLRSWVQGLNVPINGSFVMLGVRNGCIQPQFV